MFNNYSNKKCYIIAEIGGNFTTIEEAKKLIDEAAACGVDAVKLQTYRAETIASKKAIFDMENTGVASQFDLFKKYEIDEAMHREVFDYIESKGLDWFSTPSHLEDVELLERLGAGAHKIGSDDAVNIPFLKEVAKTGKPVLLSTGMCTMDEVREGVSAILEEGNDKLILFHCTTSYPTHAKDVNLLAMKAMMKEFPELSVGYSDHTIGTTACIAAAVMGARVVEKHFTYDKKAEGPDHMLSADPAEMTEIVNMIREFEVMKGNGIKMPAESEKTTRVNNRKSIVAKTGIKKGESISAAQIAIKRPGYGIAPRHFDQIVGSVAKKDIEEDDVLTWADIC